jgi:hypothetical protein
MGSTVGWLCGRPPNNGAEPGSKIGLKLFSFIPDHLFGIIPESAEMDGATQRTRDTKDLCRPKALRRGCTTPKPAKCRGRLLLDRRQPGRERPVRVTSQWRGRVALPDCWCRQPFIKVCVRISLESFSGVAPIYVKCATAHTGVWSSPAPPTGELPGGLGGLAFDGIP